MWWSQVQDEWIPLFFAMQCLCVHRRIHPSEREFTCKPAQALRPPAQIPCWPPASPRHPKPPGIHPRQTAPGRLVHPTCRPCVSPGHGVCAVRRWLAPPTRPQNASTRLAAHRALSILLISSRVESPSLSSLSPSFPPPTNLNVAQKQIKLGVEVKRREASQGTRSSPRHRRGLTT